MRRQNAYFRSFASHTEGTVAIVYSLCMIVLVCAAGLAVDTVRAHQADNALTQALDTTSLATARALSAESLDDAQLTDRAKAYFTENFTKRSSYFANVKKFDLTLDHDKNKATVTAELHLPSLIARLMRQDDFVMVRTSTAQYDLTNLELSMTLDSSGSMFGKKLADLKDAAKELTDMILKDNEEGAHNRIGLAPYSTSVNAGAFAEKATGKADKSTCVSERPGKGKATDKEPKGNPLGRKASSCPSGTVVPLSDDKDTVDNYIDSMVADGSTAGHLGIAWSWYILSPNWSSFWPSSSEPKPYDDKETVKAAVILTDGKFNMAYEDDEDSVKQAKDLCDGMKADGIRVFTIGFQAPVEAVEILKYCASNDISYFDAQDGDSLKAAFRAIGSTLTDLRITQ